LPPALEQHSEPNLFLQALDVIRRNNVAAWAKSRNQDGRLLLCTAVAASLEWIYTKRIFEANMIAIYEKDVMTGLSPFMLAAVGLNSDIESVYRLFREYPAAIGPVDTTDVPRKQVEKEGITGKKELETRDERERY